MKVKAQKQYRSVLAFDIDDRRNTRTRLFTLSIGGGQVGEEEKELKFETCMSNQDGLKFNLDQVFPADSMTMDPKKPHCIDSYYWSLKVHAIIKNGTEVYLDSSEENEGFITEVWKATQRRRNIQTVGLGYVSRNSFSSSCNWSSEETTVTLKAELTVTANIIDHQEMIQETGNSRAMGFGLFALLSKDHSDVTIKCESEEMKAHKVVLKCYSPVFARMLDSPMDESGTSVIKIDDFEPETIQDMINFMYEGTLNTCSKDSVVALLECAEKYDIAELKVVVIKKMLSTATPDNAAEFAAALTKFRGDEESKQKIFDYCKANFPKLSTNLHFRQFFVENVKNFL